MYYISNRVFDLLKLSYHRNLSGQQRWCNFSLGSRALKDSVLWLLKEKRPKQGDGFSDSFTFLLYELTFISEDKTGEVECVRES